MSRGEKVLWTYGQGVFSDSSIEEGVLVGGLSGLRTSSLQDPHLQHKLARKKFLLRAVEEEESAVDNDPENSFHLAALDGRGGLLGLIDALRDGRGPASGVDYRALGKTGVKVAGKGGVSGVLGNDPKEAPNRTGLAKMLAEAQCMAFLDTRSSAALVDFLAAEDADFGVSLLRQELHSRNNPETSTRPELVVLQPRVREGEDIFQRVSRTRAHV